MVRVRGRRPEQKAGRIAFDAGLVNDGCYRRAGVNALSYESTAVPKVCAAAILRLLKGDQPNPSSMTNSVCYSPITHREASWAHRRIRSRPGSARHESRARFERRGAGMELRNFRADGRLGAEPLRRHLRLIARQRSRFRV